MWKNTFTIHGMILQVLHWDSTKPKITAQSGLIDSLWTTNKHQQTTWKGTNFKHLYIIGWICWVKIYSNRSEFTKKAGLW